MKGTAVQRSTAEPFAELLRCIGEPTLAGHAKADGGMADKVCFLAPRSSRSGREDAATSHCSGRLSALEGRSARAAGFRQNVTLCFRHAVDRRRLTEARCFLAETSSCSGRIRKAPERILVNFLASDHPDAGTHMCEGHLKEADEDDRWTQQPTYTPPNKVSNS